MVNSPAWVAVVEERGVALHQGDGELLKEVGDGGGFVFPGVSGESAPKLLNLSNCGLVPSTKIMELIQVKTGLDR